MRHSTCPAGRLCVRGAPARAIGSASVALLTLVLAACSSSAPDSPRPTATVTEPAASPSPSATSSPVPTPAASETGAAGYATFLTRAREIDPSLSDTDDDEVLRLGTLACDAVQTGLAGGLSTPRMAFDLYVGSLKVNVDKDPSRRENAQTLLDVARAGVPLFCPEYLADSDELDEQL